jgi:hypothetical protein
MLLDLNCVNVAFDIAITAPKHGERRVHEVHRMRYLFLPEIEQLLREAGFDRTHSLRWMSAAPADDQSWYACVAARAVRA